jgi:hypothetical protein
MLIRLGGKINAEQMSDAEQEQLKVKERIPPLNRNKAPVPILILVVRRYQHKNKEPHRQRGT